MTNLFTQIYDTVWTRFNMNCSFSAYTFTRAVSDIDFFMLLTLFLLKYFSYICDKNKLTLSNYFGFETEYLIKLFQKHVVCTKLHIYVLIINIYCRSFALRQWISQSNVTSNAQPEMWCEMQWEVHFETCQW